MRNRDNIFKAFSALICLAAAFCLLNTGFSIQQITAGNPVLDLSNAAYLETVYSPGISIKPWFTAAGYLPYHGEQFTKGLDSGNRMTVLYGEFLAAKDLTNTPLSLYFGPSDYPYSVYLNHRLLFTRGTPGVRQKGEYRSSFFTSLDYSLSSDLLLYSPATNRISFELYPTYETGPFDLPELITSEQAALKVFVRDLFNVHLIQSACLVSIFIGLYFLLRFFSRKLQDRHFLYFSLICIFFSLSYFNIFFNNNSIHELLNEKITRSCFPVAALFICFFVREFTRVTSRKLWLSVVLSSMAVFSSVWVWLLGSKEAVYKFFTTVTSNAVITPLLVFSVGVLIYSFIRKRRFEYLIILFSFAIVVLASLYDLNHLTTGNIPFCWLVPYSYLLLLITIFVVLAMDESRMFLELQQKADEIAKKNESMKMVMERIDTVSKNLIHSSASIEEDIQKAVIVIEETSWNNQEITKKLLKELAGIEELAKQMSLRIDTAGDRIPRAIQSQTSVVEETNTTVEKLYSQIEEITDSALKSSRVAQELSNIASESKNIVLQSKESIQRISEYSIFISDIIKQVSGIAEDSNVLAINAAIEAVQAGEKGKGFGIVASEIRKLAARSKQSLEESQAKLKQMSSFIQQGLSQSAEVTSLLLTIIEKTGQSSEMISGISNMMGQQKKDSKYIQEGAQKLLKDTLSIKELSAEEQKENEQIKGTLTGLKTSFEEITALLKFQSQGESSIQTAMEQIGKVLEENKKNSGILRETLELKGE
jgi:hypothetical protein